MRVNESGRSMIEMLGVLAIIGVLSVGGIAGYSKAMNKFKTNQVADNVSMLVANIKTLYAQQKTYTGLNNTSAVSMGVVPDELGTSATLTNAFNGNVFIASGNSTTGETGNRAFVIAFAGLSKEACITLATNDWGSGYSSGLIYIKATGAKNETYDITSAAGLIGCSGSTAAGSAVACPGHNMPMPVQAAANACNCNAGNQCAIQWKYY